MVVGVRFRDSRLHMRMRVSTDRHGFINIECVVVDERHHASHLRQYEERQQR